MRLFIAIDIPDAVQQKIAKLYCNFHGVHWSPPERLHITLAFLGQINKQILPSLNTALESVVFHPFEIECDRFGSFRSGDIWLGIIDEAPIVQLHECIMQRLKELGLGIQTREFKPHITLAYTKRNEEDVVLNVLESRRTFDTLSFTVDHFNLKSSWRRENGAALHRIEAIYHAQEAD
jgi:2'-5' RNA ligase